LAPVDPFSAYSMPSSEPTYTVPSAPTAGVPQICTNMGRGLVRSANDWEEEGKKGIGLRTKEGQVLPTPQQHTHHTQTHTSDITLHTSHITLKTVLGTTTEPKHTQAHMSQPPPPHTHSHTHTRTHTHPIDASPPSQKQAWSRMTLCSSGTRVCATAQHRYTHPPEGSVHARVWSDLVLGCKAPPQRA
jgi:hypothetical protein